MKKWAAMVAVLLLAAVFCMGALSESYSMLSYDNFCINMKEYTKYTAYEKVVRLYEEAPYDFQIESEPYAYYRYAKGMMALGLVGADYPVNLQEADEIFTNLYEMFGKKFPDELLLQTVKSENRSRVADCETVYMYTKARVAEENGQYKEAIDLYNETKGFADSVKRVFDINEQHPTPVDRITDVQYEAGNDFVRLTWADSGTAESYTVAYMPKGGGDVAETATAFCEATMNGLLPDTEYLLQLSAGGEFLKEIPVKTKYTSLSGAIVCESRAMVDYCKKTDREMFTLGDLIRRGMMAESGKTDEGKYRVLVNKGFSEGFYQYFLKIDVFNRSEEKQELQWLLVLRLDDGGTFSFGETTAAPKSNPLIPTSIFFPVSDVLAQAFVYNDGVWPQTSGVIDLYIDGMYTDEVSITLIND